MSTMDKTELIESLRNRIEAFRNGHADQVLDRHALAEAAELLDRAEMTAGASLSTPPRLWRGCGGLGSRRCLTSTTRPTSRRR